MNARMPNDCAIADWVANPHVGPCNDFTLVTDGYVNTNLFLPISKDRQICLAMHRLYADWKYADLFASPRFLGALDAPAATLSDAVLFTGSANHWHFVTDGLASLSSTVFETCTRLLVDESLSDDPTGFAMGFARHAFGVELSVERLPAGTYAASTVYVPTSKPLDHKMRTLKPALVRLGDTSPDDAGPRRLYVTREGAGTRRLLNEEALAGMLGSEFGFERVRNESLSLAEQAALYRNAEIVLGPHGAGLTNVVFARKPRALIELYHSFPQPFFATLAGALDLKYAAIEGSADPATAAPGSDEADFTVEMERVRTAIARLLAP